ncbi:scw [Drosophila busckii]|uniref:Scw n=1 Tax=Drosophila busckii TaxID=30019 RepID=A0A0M4ESY0_DROBS|nr:scw [Drosophila busckii]
MEQQPPVYQGHYSEQLDMLDLLDLGDRPRRMAQPTLHNAASKFLLEVYNEINEEQEPLEVLHQRHKRSLDDDILISKKDRQEIASCNSILTFCSRSLPSSNEQHLLISFNTNNVPADLSLVQARLRVYKQAAQLPGQQNITLSVYRRVHSHLSAASGELNEPVYRILQSLNTTSSYRGWLEFNLTQTLRAWLLLNKSLPQARHELRISLGDAQWSVHSMGLLPLQAKLEPYIVGYFDGPELLVKVQKLRFKRDLHKRKATLPNGLPLGASDHHKPSHSCERLNFTVDFKELQMHNWVIAPKKFDAYFCGGGCNFPLGTKMNATNHAIVQTLMHLKQPHLPKPCCVPTLLGSITILRYLNEDIIDLTKYKKTVAKECGCH